MKKSCKIAVVMFCAAILFSQSLTCLAAEKPKQMPLVPSKQPKQIEQPAEPEEPKHQPFLDHWHTSIPDNSTPLRYGLPGDDWDAYSLAEAMDGSFGITLFGDFPNTVTVADIDQGLYEAELQEKIALLNGEIELTSQLNELMLVSASGGHFPHTKNNGQLFTGTMRILPYNGVIHHIMISEEYTVKPGDTLGQIILDCGWLPEGRNLYGENGYLEQYATEQKLDPSAALIPGQVVLWHSEDIQIVDNLYPDIEINIIPGHFFSGGEPATFDEAPETINSIPVISDIIAVTNDAS